MEQTPTRRTSTAVTVGPSRLLAGRSPSSSSSSPPGLRPGAPRPTPSCSRSRRPTARSSTPPRPRSCCAFSEPVSLTGGSAGVLDDDAAEVVSTGAQSVDDSVVIALPSGLADGTYTVTWQVISVDSHRISGRVGVPRRGPVGRRRPRRRHRRRRRRLGRPLRRLRCCRPSPTPAPSSGSAGGGGWCCSPDDATTSGSRPRPNRRGGMVVGRAMVLGAVALVAALPFRIAKVGGGLDALRDDDFLWASLRGPIGVATAVTAVGAARHGRPDGPGPRPASRRLGRARRPAPSRSPGSPSRATPARSDPLALMIGFDVVHLAAAALWIGGIAGLVVAFRSRRRPDRPRADGRPVQQRGRRLGRRRRRSPASAWPGSCCPSLDDLVSTGYGLALLTKVALVAVVVALGAYNNRRLVPVVSAGDGASGRAAATPGPHRAGRAGAAAGRRRRHRRARRPVAGGVGQAAPAAVHGPGRRRRAAAVERRRHGLGRRRPGAGRVQRDPPAAARRRRAAARPGRDADRGADRADARSWARCARSSTCSAPATSTSSPTSRSPAAGS